MTKFSVRDVFVSRTRRILAVSIVLLAVAYYGVPVFFLKYPVQDHLSSRYGLHADVGSVRVSLRGLVVTGVSAVWPKHGATLEIKELTLGFNPIKSLRRRRPVFEKLKLIYPVITIQWPDQNDLADTGANSPAPAEVVEAASDTQPRDTSTLPASFDVTIRRGKVHLKRGSSSAWFHQVDAEFEQSRPGEMVAWMKIDSLQMGSLELAFEEGHRLKIDAASINLFSLSELTGSPQVIHGFLSARVDRDEDRVFGEARVEQLAWTGPEQPVSASDTDVPIVSFIDPPLDLRADWAGRWSSPDIFFDESKFEVGGVPLRISGQVRLSRLIESRLEFHVPEFDEPSLERISGHFRVLRYLHAFLEKIQSPSIMQAKMNMTGPLTRPVDWRYDGLIDIRPDSFSYQPFLGQYSFMGTVLFNQSSVTIPEIVMPFGSSSLVLSGTAADYSSHSADLTLNGSALSIGPMLYYHTPDEAKPDDTSEAALPTGQADVHLRLTRQEHTWNLDGTVDAKRISIPSKMFLSPVQAYGRMNFSGSQAEGSLRTRIGAFETTLNPFVHGLFTPEAQYGIALRQDGIRWDRFSKALARPLPYVPVSGEADVSLKVSSGSETGVFGTVDLRSVRFRLPPFSTPVDDASGVLSFEKDFLRLKQVRGILAGSAVSAEGSSVPGDPWSWSLEFTSDSLDLAALFRDIHPMAKEHQERQFEVNAEVWVKNRLRFRAFEIPGAHGKFTVRPRHFDLQIDTPIRSEYESVFSPKPRTTLSFFSDQPYPIKKLFASSGSMGGDVTGTIVIKGPNLGDSEAISGEMDLLFDKLAFRRATPMLTLIDLMRLSLSDAVVFEPFRFRSPINRGMVDIDLDQPSSAGRWIFQGRLGLDATYHPLTSGDKNFHVTFYPRENIITHLLNETKILNLFGGKREGIKLDFGLVGNYNNSNILWTEEPLVSVIRGRVSELVPGFFPAAAVSDTERNRTRDTPAPRAPSPSSP